jgi:hypothetical protein
MSKKHQSCDIEIQYYVNRAFNLSQELCQRTDEVQALKTRLDRLEVMCDAQSAALALAVAMLEDS